MKSVFDFINQELFNAGQPGKYIPYEVFEKISSIGFRVNRPLGTGHPNKFHKTNLEIKRGEIYGAFFVLSSLIKNGNYQIIYDNAQRMYYAYQGNKRVLTDSEEKILFEIKNELRRIKNLWIEFCDISQ